MRAQYIDHMGDDLAVVNAARVSFDKVSSYVTLDEDGNEVELPEVEGFNSKFFETPKVLREKDVKLISYLAKHDHWTPFAHTAIKMRMAAPVPIRTQCFKHKVGMVENEESRRYISVEPEIYVPLFRQATANKKQGSGDVFTGKEQYALQEDYERLTKAAVEAYKDFLARGVCEEQARFLLPQGAVVNWIWTGNLVSFANFYKKRAASDAQKEVQLLAKEVDRIIAPLFPHSWKALTA
ncbi:FAD-dependent thymidylate synthase [Marisediminitalea sp.]|uniref:FAD-dependent thymidylate synthase n=1 Tax=Marisediminitalea sp. TaxID=2662268 RepID=UPI0035137077